jgi:hypothetical protein
MTSKMLEKSKSLSHESQIYIAENIAQMREKLGEFFKKARESGKALTAEDV